MGLAAIILFAAALGSRSEGQKEAEWVVLFNNRDTTGWKLRQDKINVTKFVDEKEQVIPGAKAATLDQKDTVVDAKNKPIEGAKITKIDGKDTPVDADGKPIKDAKIAKTGSRKAIVGADNKEIANAKRVTETAVNTSGWEVKDGELICAKPHGGNDLVTEQKFTDFELHVEFQATSNSGVYLQGRYEIQVNDNYGTKPKVVEKDGKKVEVFDTHQCGALYGKIAPSKNMAKPAKEWQSFDVVFRGARGDKGKVTHKARVTVIWNGEKVIDDAEIDGTTGGALDSNVTEPGPLLLQGDHGRVAFRNIKVRPLPAK